MHQQQARRVAPQISSPKHDSIKQWQSPLAQCLYSLNMYASFSSLSKRLALRGLQGASPGELDFNEVYCDYPDAFILEPKWRPRKAPAAAA